MTEKKKTTKKPSAKKQATGKKKATAAKKQTKPKPKPVGATDAPELPDANWESPPEPKQPEAKPQAPPVKENKAKPAPTQEPVKDITHAVVIRSGRHYTTFFHEGAILRDKNLIRQLMPKGDGRPTPPECIKLEVFFNDGSSIHD